MAKKSKKIGKEFLVLSLEDIHPYENNPRLNEDAVPYVVESIKQCTDLDPIEVDENNVILSGHTRLLAMQQLGYKEADCIRYSGLSEAQKKKYRLLANKVAEKSFWDFDKLPEELEGLDFDGFDFGFGDLEGLDFDAVSGNAGDDSEVVEDDYEEEPPEEPKSKLGDLYQLGGHRLICGDSTDIAVIDRLMDGVKADMVFTDPTYGVSIGDKNATLNSVKKAVRCCKNIENDTLPADELYETLKQAFINVREHCEDDAVYYVTSPQGGSLGLMMMMMRDAGLEVRHVLMWKKNSATFSLGRLDYDYQHEPIFYTWTKSHHNYRNGKYRTTVWEYDKQRKCDMHPTMKPIELVGNAVLDGTMEGMKVLDVFGGSGSTLIACEQLNRKCYMCELDPHYVDVIIDRWEQFTGHKAVKLN